MGERNEVGPLDCITILLKNDHQHRRRVTFPPAGKLAENGSDYSLPSSRGVRWARNPRLLWWLGGPEPVGAPQRAGKRKIKDLILGWGLPATWADVDNIFCQKDSPHVDSASRL